MKRFVLAAAVAAAIAAAPALAADVGVSISVGQPGFYGRIDIGDYPAPRLLYRDPVIVGRVAVDRPPIYLHVPSEHAAHWSRYCGQYGACGERVYFVDHGWYDREYVPRYQERHRDHDEGRHEEHYEGHHDERHEERHEGYRDDRREHEHERGRDY